MQKKLFFDDNGLFIIENLKRKYGSYEIAAVYRDPACSTDLCTAHVFKLDDGRYRMLYFAHGKSFAGKKLFSAISDNCIDFTPEALFDPAEGKKCFCNELFDLPTGGEIAYIYEDKRALGTDERYKLLMAVLDGGKLAVTDLIMTSPDLIQWKTKENVYWGNGAEPLAGVFYNDREKVHTILQRPFWGIRRVGYKETTDWNSFSEYRECLNVDALDEPRAEIYGMFAFPYEGAYIGIPHLYRGLKNERNAKYKNGYIDTQLAYSYDGRCWRRCLREPFISGLQNETYRNPMTWVTDMKVLEDGEIYFYGSASEKEHGAGFASKDSGKIMIYKMRADGFMPLVTEERSLPSIVATRELIWQGGELHLNLKAQNATVAIYSSSADEVVLGNVLGHTCPIQGMTHEDCIPFSGDSRDLIPTYQSGKCLDDLKGQTIVVEIRFEDGELYSLSGDFVDAFNTEAARYRKFGIMP